MDGISGVSGGNYGNFPNQSPPGWNAFQKEVHELDNCAVSLEDTLISPQHTQSQIDALLSNLKDCANAIQRCYQDPQIQAYLGTHLDSSQQNFLSQFASDVLQKVQQIPEDDFASSVKISQDLLKEADHAWSLISGF